jgi:hypothetical protein
MRGSDKTVCPVLGGLLAVRKGSEYSLFECPIFLASSISSENALGKICLTHPVEFRLLWKKERHMTGREEIECRKLREAAEWLKKMEQRYAKQRKEVEARYRRLLPQAHKRLQHATNHG